MKMFDSMSPAAAPREMLALPTPSVSAAAPCVVISLPVHSATPPLAKHSAEEGRRLKLK
jgi:hypothetical protein